VKIIEFTGDIEKAKMCAFVMRGVVLQRKGMQGSVTIKVHVFMFRILMSIESIES